MKRSLATISGLIAFWLCCSCQYREHSFYLSGGLNYSRYLGAGEGGNYFVPERPGLQLEAVLNNEDGFQWLFWGIAHYGTYNYSGDEKVSVGFWTPYYTEVLFYSKEKRHPLFCFFGYDYTRMKFPDMADADPHHNITFGGGWNLKLSNDYFMQFKIKPYFILGNSIWKSEDSIGQIFGINCLLNLQIGF